MKRLRIALATTLVALAAVCHPGSPTFAVGGSIDDEQDTVTLEDEIRAHREHREFVRNPPAREVRLVEYALAPLCNVNSQFLIPGIEGECSPSNGTVTRPGCGDDEAVMPLWRRSRTSASTPWTRWDMIVGWICPDDLIPRLTEKDFRRLKIESPEAHRQPATGDVLVNKPLIVYTERVERTFRTSLFDAGIDVVATPLEYAWTFGDGGTLITTSPGAPYPSFELTHLYSQPTTGTVTLTTTWSGRFRVDEDPDHEWREIEGTALTTTTLAPFDVIELRSRLDG